jgi:uncharacterized protein YnzC (UPF0291/DUF896 family)
MTQILTQGYLILKINELEKLKAKCTPLERETIDERLKELRAQRDGSPNYLKKFKDAFLRRI